MGLLAIWGHSALIFLTTVLRERCWLLAPIVVLTVAILRRPLKLAFSPNNLDWSEIYLLMTTRGPLRQTANPGFRNRFKMQTTGSDGTLSGDPSEDSDDMRYQRPPRHIRKKLAAAAAVAAGLTLPSKSKQLFDMFLVLDIEGTCNQGSGFDFPNEIIEFPVSLLAWKDKAEDMTASELEVVDEFRSFVRPTWRPTLSTFCKELTGIQQVQVDAAPLFPEVIAQFEKFMMKNRLIDENGERLVRFCWCTDGPFDIRNFVVKQCFISKFAMPWWFKGDFIDVRAMVLRWLSRQKQKGSFENIRQISAFTKRTLNIPAQLEVLELPIFEGRQHSGIDDTRNIAKIVAELGRRGVPLLPNSNVQSQRRWMWMGKKGQVLDEHLA